MANIVALSQVRYPRRCRPGDRVAVLSPSAALPAVYPHVHELGLRRLVDAFGLVPVEFPTTRQLGSSPAARAADIVAAFADPSIAAVIATIGGDDQIAVLRHLDAALIAANPKPFFGYSDNTNLLNYLVNLGMVAYHGGSTMVHLGRGGRLHDLTASSLRAALFQGGEHELRPPNTFSVNALPWDDPANLQREPPTQPASPWRWHGDGRVVEGRLWGGCLEILDWTLQVGRYVAPVEHHRSSVLFIETSEEMPTSAYVYRTLRNMGERGLLGVIDALLVGRPVSEAFGTTATAEQIAAAEDEQHAAVVRAVDEYHPGLPVVVGIDAGHTDPQLILPLGGLVRVDTKARRITVTY